MSRVKVALDFCLSHRMVRVLSELYGHHGYEFLHLRELVPAATNDSDWADVYRKFGGRLVLSGDPRIAYRPHQAVAFIDNGLISFFPAGAWARLTGTEKASVLVYWWPAISLKAREAEGGTCWRIPCEGKSGDIRLRSKALERLLIPDEVLDEARKARGAR